MRVGDLAPEDLDRVDQLIGKLQGLALAHKRRPSMSGNRLPWQPFNELTHFGDLSELEHAKWVATTTCPVGVFVFHRTEADETGTLEDHLAPMVESAWPDRYADVRSFTDDNRKPCDEVSRNDATRLKAIITSAGQFDHPGDPLSTMIARHGIPQAQFAESPMSRALVDFLQGVPWCDGQPPSDAA